MLTYDEMDELCMWVTGFSKTVMILNTTDERRSYAGKRAIGINGINVPVTNSDILSRCFINEHEAIPDGKDGKDGILQVKVKERSDSSSFFSKPSLINSSIINKASLI